MLRTSDRLFAVTDQFYIIALTITSVKKCEDDIAITTEIDCKSYHQHATAHHRAYFKNIYQYSDLSLSSTSVFTSHEEAKQKAIKLIKASIVTQTHTLKSLSDKLSSYEGNATL